MKENNSLNNIKSLLVSSFVLCSLLITTFANAQTKSVPELNNIFRLEKQSNNQWVVMENGIKADGMRERCTPEYVRDMLKDMDNVKVVSVEIETGQPDIPDACHVILEEMSPGGNPVMINVWAPLEWNGRFMGCVGGGLRTFHMYDILGRQNRIAMPKYVLKNGFATANTDGGVPGETFAWGLDEKTKGINYELIINYAYRSTHTMTVIAKKVITAIYGMEPKYSYVQGASGGGRQSLMEAQLYPGDYDGIWSVDPAINFTELFMSFVWPYTVMNSENHVISPDKLEFFRTAAIEKTGAKHDFIENLEIPEFDPYDYVGQQAADGIITKEDAKIMKLIFEGPKTQDGRFIWYGYRPGTRFWNTQAGLGGTGALVYQKNEEGSYVPVFNQLALGYHSAWLERDMLWDEKELDYKKFEEMYNTGLRDFNFIQTNNPNLNEFRNKGNKLLLTHAVNDDIIASDGTLDYYKKVIEYMGGEDEISSFLRFFLSPGGGHTDLAQPGLSFTLADGMIALMKWVEEGIEPEVIPAVQYDFKQNASVLTGNVSLYSLGKTEIATDIQETEAWTKHEAEKAAVNTSSRLNRNTPINEILKDEQGAAILNEYIGSLLENPQMEMAKTMSIGALEDMIPMPDTKKKIGEAIKKLEELE